jgi:regulator of protease activity HflC (stomatin/prohibitin superfamily)
LLSSYTAYEEVKPMGIRRTSLLILLPLATLIAIFLVFVLNVKVGLLAFAASFVISTLLILIVFRVIEVNSYERLIVSRGGRFVDTGIQGGRAFLIRGLERPIPVDLRQRREDVVGDRCFTNEGIGVDIDYFFLWKVVDPMRYLLGPKDVAGTLKGMASAILKNEVGKMSLLEVLRQRDNISQKLKMDLKNFDKASYWGIEFIAIELGSTKIPPEIEKAMARIVAQQISRRKRSSLFKP